MNYDEETKSRWQYLQIFGSTIVGRAAAITKSK